MAARIGVTGGSLSAAACQPFPLQLLTATGCSAACRKPSTWVSQARGEVARP
jgi:hypothetical protein